MVHSPRTASSASRSLTSPSTTSSGSGYGLESVMPKLFKVPTWTIHFPTFSCPWCKRRIKTAYYGGRFKFWKAGAGRPVKKEAFPVEPKEVEENGTIQ